MRQALRILLFAAVAAAGVSCSAVRRCKAPELALLERFAGLLPDDSLTIADMAWWQFFGDSTLLSIIRRTLDNNREMLAAAARVERMRALYRVEKANRLPDLKLNALADYETNDYSGESAKRDAEFGSKATLGWEADLWGNLRWAKRKGEAEYRATVEDERAMRMTLVAEAASAYFRLDGPRQRAGDRAPHALDAARGGRAGPPALRGG